MLQSKVQKFKPVGDRSYASKTIADSVALSVSAKVNLLGLRIVGIQTIHFRGEMAGIKALVRYIAASRRRRKLSGGF